jgi:lipid-binding SYLF domain-containing protein
MKPEKQNIPVVAVAVVAIMVIAGRSPQASADDSREKQVKDAASQSAKAAKAFDDIMQVPDKAIPRDLIAQAKAIAVFPQVIKVAFAAGGGGGRGVVSRHIGDAWGEPVFFRARGGSVGPQIGASSTDFVLLLMDDASVEALMKDKFELGAEVTATGGPVGATIGAGTETRAAQILSYSRSRGLFAGANVKGVVIRPEDDLNMTIYSKTARELLGHPIGADATPAAGLKAFPQALGRYASAPSEDR